MQLMPVNTASVGAEPRRIASLRAAAVPGDQSAPWTHGVITWPESAPGWEVVQECTDLTVDYGLGEVAAPVGSRPFMVRSLTRCPKTTNLDILTQRARRHIEAVTGPGIARELWTGDATALDPWTLPDAAGFTLANPRPDGDTATGPGGPWLNPHLADGQLSDTPAAAPEAIGRVEAAAADLMPGAPVFLHIPAALVLELGAYLTGDGDLLRTPLGSVVVADAGYPGTAVDGGPLVVYGTGPVQLWIGDPIVYSAPEQVVKPSTNEIGVWAERPACVLFDPQTLVGCPVSAA